MELTPTEVKDEPTLEWGFEPRASSFYTLIMIGKTNNNYIGLTSVLLLHNAGIRCSKI